MLWIVLVVASLLLLLRGTCVETFTVPSSSMTPTLRPGDRVAVWKPDSSQVRRGEVVVFDAGDAFGLDRPASGLAGWLRSAGHVAGIRVGETDFVKRIVAVGGDRVSIGTDGVLRVNDAPVREPYLDGRTESGGAPFRTRVPSGTVFVLGDNRANSDDSRAFLGAPGGGMVPTGDIIGRVALRYWPLGSWGTLPW